MGLELHKFDVELPEDVSLALVICGDLGVEEQRHTGFVVRNMMGETYLFHLATHNDFRKGQVSLSYNYLLIPYLEPAVEVPIVAFLFLLHHDTQGRISYSTEYQDRDYFDGDGKLVLVKPSDGFTCATFVLETMRKYGMDLVDRSTWPINEKDAEWQRNIIGRVGLNLEEFLAQIENIGEYPRFRPEQALGAAHYYEGKKLSYNVVHPAGLEVIYEMARLRA
ncbi:hypothetical protein [Pseudomonas asgharzadehiana]|uniref:Uncharacterized protein n=1 Tax=Pseudomonas asgharzadehiana TaxID=2842349 RepID=A0ABX8P581_9PSED|nr:hypothetical protein [Pseudomonas asgharzadehiana]QXH68580.1 hypothetical protein KSS96_06495 [Pseudomonas asgharzadehiana]